MKKNKLFIIIIIFLVFSVDMLKAKDIVGITGDIIEEIFTINGLRLDVGNYQPSLKTLNEKDLAKRKFFTPFIEENLILGGEIIKNISPNISILFGIRRWTGQSFMKTEQEFEIYDEKILVKIYPITLNARYKIWQKNKFNFYGLGGFGWYRCSVTDKLIYKNKKIPDTSGDRTIIIGKTGIGWQIGMELEYKISPKIFLNGGMRYILGSVEDIKIQEIRGDRGIILGNALTYQENGKRKDMSIDLNGFDLNISTGFYFD